MAEALIADIGRTGDIDQIKADFVTACHILVSERVAEASFNVSCRLPDGQIMVHPISSPTLVTTDNLEIHPLGAELKNYKAHPAIYQARPDVQAIVHTHPPYTIAFGTLNEDFRPVHHYGAPFHGKITTFHSPGQTKSEGRAEEIARQLGENRALLQQGHGCIVVGKDLKEALQLVLYLEEACRILFLARQMGTPQYLSMEESEVISAQILKQRSQDKAWLHYADKLRIAAQRPAYSDRLSGRLRPVD
jgi:ribulose-5-phosphate 4-epimerase/fuculose-1-phosphate aldolase